MIPASLQRYYWVLVLVAWGSLAIFVDLFRFDPYGIREAAAQALLVNWSVAEQIVNPIVIFGAPDFRALLFAPMGAYWPGSMVAVKIFTALIMFLATMLLYRWSKDRFSSEIALIASGLLLIAPLTWHEINSLSAAPYLLLTFGLGILVNEKYRATQRQLSGWYFMQLFLVLVTVSMHPAGLAYPLALAWEWWRNPVDKRQQKQVFWGIAIAVVFVLVFRFGWRAMDWLQNPLVPLGAIWSAPMPDALIPPTAWSGLLPAILIAAVVFFSRAMVLRELWPRMLLFSVIFGSVAADHGWALLALTLLLYLGTWKLVSANAAIEGNSFFGQRGIVMIVVFVTATTFMIGDKTLRASHLRQALSAQDRTIQWLALELGDADEPVKISSQWPARTMLATRHPAFPLPPAMPDGPTLLSKIEGIRFLLFDPFDPDNAALTRNVSEMTNAFETVTVDERSVIIKVRNIETHKEPGASQQQDENAANSPTP